MTSQSQVGALQIRGERTNRQDVRTANVMAVLAVANIVKSSLGPAGLDKVRGRAQFLPQCATRQRAAGARSIRYLRLDLYNSEAQTFWVP